MGWLEHAFISHWIFTLGLPSPSPSFPKLSLHPAQPREAKGESGEVLVLFWWVAQRAVPKYLVLQAGVSLPALPEGWLARHCPRCNGRAPSTSHPAHLLFWERT